MPLARRLIGDIVPILRSGPFLLAFALSCIVQSQKTWRMRQPVMHVLMRGGEFALHLLEISLLRWESWIIQAPPTSEIVFRRWAKVGGNARRSGTLGAKFR